MGHKPLLLAVALAAGCTGHSGGGSSSAFGGEDGGQSAPAVPDGSTVGFLETQAPALTEFVLRGTLPVPPGTFPRADGAEPFTLLDYDGTVLPTQTELVTRYPDEADGADVVEVLARVRRDPGLAVGTKLRYEIVQEPQAAGPDPGAPGVEDLVNGTLAVPQSVQDFLADPNALQISVYDTFGNEYVCRPLNGLGTAKLLRRGPVHTELRVHQNMVPLQPDPGPQGTLPHFFGVHAYLSTLQGHEIVGLDLRFHVGHSGRNQASALDDPLDKVYFDRIELRVPSSWFLLQDFEDPFFGDGVVVGNERVHALVEPNPAGKQHVVRWQGQFHRRLMLARGAETGTARGYLQCAGQAFCVPGSDPVTGEEYWSWWNRGTARYFPQNYQLPALDHVANVAGTLRSNHDWIEAHLLNGTSEKNDYPIAAGVLGWGHPYGVAYGGMAGGPEIFLSDGVSTAWAASRWGLRTYRALHRMHTDRMPNAFYDRDGEPTSVERWLRTSATGSYVPFDHFLVPKIEPNDPFGLSSAPRFQIQHVEGTGLQPAYESVHMGYEAHDYQHFIRYTRSAKVLLWLGNDSLAKDDLRMQAENFHLSYHTHNNNAGGGYQSSGMKTAQQYVLGLPASGLPFGRGEAWGIDCALAAYAAADPAWRTAKLGWLRDVAQLVSNGQGACSGFIQANVSPRFADGKYRSRQAVEQSITENMLQGLRETVFRKKDPAHSVLVRDVLGYSAYAAISPMAWFPGQPAPWTFTAVGWANPSWGVWCSPTQIPGGGWTPSYERYQNWSSFAYGYELSDDPIFLLKATQEIGGGDLLTALEQAGLNNLENRSALLALTQRLYRAP